MSKQYSANITKMNPDTGLNAELGRQKDGYSGHGYTRRDDNYWRRQDRKTRTLRSHRESIAAAKGVRHFHDRMHKAGKLPTMHMVFKDHDLTENMYDEPMCYLDMLNEMETERVRAEWERTFGERYEAGLRRMQKLAKAWAKDHPHTREAELDYAA